MYGLFNSFWRYAATVKRLEEFTRFRRLPAATGVLDGEGGAAGTIRGGAVLLQRLFSRHAGQPRVRGAGGGRPGHARRRRAPQQRPGGRRPSRLRLRARRSRARAQPAHEARGQSGAADGGDRRRHGVRRAPTAATRTWRRSAASARSRSIPARPSSSTIWSWRIARFSVSGAPSSIRWTSAAPSRSPTRWPACLEPSRPYERGGAGHRERATHGARVASNGPSDSNGSRRREKVAPDDDVRDAIVALARRAGRARARRSSVPGGEAGRSRTASCGCPSACAARCHAPPRTCATAGSPT